MSGYAEDGYYVDGYAQDDIFIDWDTKIIYVPKQFTQFVSVGAFEIRQLNMDDFRLALRRIEAEVYGIVNVRTHIHNTTVTVGGVTLARVVIIINGYTITFENGNYAVNLVGANTNAADVTNLNNVQIRSANSAGLTFSEEINNQSYIGAKVFINTVGQGLSGTQFPRGTPTSPVDNWTDANAIAQVRNFRNYDLTGSLDFSTETSIVDTNWLGVSPISAFIINPSPPLNISGCTFDRIQLTGYFQGSASYNESALGGPLGFNGFHGVANSCGINGNIKLDEGELTSCVLVNCFSTLDDVSAPIFDCNDIVNTDVQFLNFTGPLKLTNFTGSTNTLSIHMISGLVELDSSCSSGTIVIRGVTKLIDNSASGCTVITDGLINTENINALSFDNGEIFIDVANGVTGTTYPIGTRQNPVNNITDAISIANKLGSKKFKVRDTLVVSNTNIDGFIFIGDAIDSVVVLAPNSGNSTVDCTFINIGLAGQLQGYCFGDRVALQEVSNIGSDTFPTVFAGAFIRNNITTDSLSFNPNLTTPQDVHFIDCHSMALDDEVISINMNNSGTAVGFRRFGGSLTLRNHTSGQASTFEFNQGKLTIDASCTSGTTRLSGIYRLVNNGTLNVVENNTSITDNIDFSEFSEFAISGDTESVAAAVWDKLTADHQTADTFGRLLNDLLVASGQIQQTNNLNTELLKNKPNNP